MDANELKQEIEKQAAKVIGRKYDQENSDFQKVVTSYILLQLEKDGDNQERMEAFMPKVLEAISGIGGSDKVVRDLQSHNIQLQQSLAEAQDMLRRLAVDTTKYAMDAVGRGSGTIGDARFEMLASQDDVYDLEEKIDEVDWQAVHDLRIRAPRYVDVKGAAAQENAEAWAKDEGAWIYVSKDGVMSFNECQVTGVGYLNENTAAVYLVVDVSEEDESLTKSLLKWERRFLYTAQMSKGRQEDLRVEMKKRSKNQ